MTLDNDDLQAALEGSELAQLRTMVRALATHMRSLLALKSFPEDVQRTSEELAQAALEYLACVRSDIKHVRSDHGSGEEMSVINKVLPQCPVCGAFLKRHREDEEVTPVELSACSACYRTSAQEFTGTTTVDSKSVHIHVTCGRCRFQWCETPHAAGLVKEVW